MSAPFHMTNKPYTFCGLLEFCSCVSLPSNPEGRVEEAYAIEDKDSSI